MTSVLRILLLLVLSASIFFPKTAFAESRQNIAGVWNLRVYSNGRGATINTPCCASDGAQPGDCGTALNGSFQMGDPVIQVTQTGNSIFASEGDPNNNLFTLQGTIKGNSVVFTIKGRGITPCYPDSQTTSTTYRGTILGATIQGTHSGTGWWSYKNEKEQTITENYSWNGNFTVGIIRPPVLLVHGFRGKSGDWNKMTSWLENDGFEVFTIDYPTESNTDIRKIAENKLKTSINNILKNSNHGDKDPKNDLPKEITYVNSGINKVDIIAHSMGGLISRWYTTSAFYNNDVKKLIMLGTPNHGSVAYKWLSEKFGWENWTQVKQMRPGSEFLSELNKKPLAAGVWHGVIAGTGFKTQTDGILEITDEPDKETTMEGDKIVTVKSASLTGAQIWILPKAEHATLPRNKDVYTECIKYLK